MEASVATKNQGLREGYKWLVKSVIANYLDLGERVARDMAKEQKAEEERRKAVRKRIEERRKKEEDEQNNGVGGAHQESFDPPGFVPVETLRAKWAGQENDSSMIVNVSGDSELSPSTTVAAPPSITSPAPGQLSARDLRDRLELEPVHGPKKRGLLSKFNRGQPSEVRSLDSRISGESREGEETEGARRGAHTGYRNWGLAEELQPSG